MRRLVVGMGASGLAMARHWTRAGFSVDAVDERHAPPLAEVFARELPDVRRRCGEPFRSWTEDMYDDYDGVGISPGVAPAMVTVTRDKLTTESSMFAEIWRAEKPAEVALLAITGTNGKSTTAALAAHLCSCAGLPAEAIGNFGEPMLDALERWRRDGFPAVAAAELSSFQLELTADFVSDAAVVLNVGDDHLDRHGTRQNYAETKGQIYRQTRRAVVNLDNDALPAGALTDAADKPQTTFSVAHGGDWTLSDGAVVGGCTASGGGFSYPLSAMSSACRAQPVSLLAALALLSDLPADADALAAGLASFPGLPHRQEFVATIDGVHYINDSKATNVDAALFALAATDTKGGVILIAGGDGKGQDFSPLCAARGRVRQAVLLGRDAAALARVLAAADVAVDFAADMDDAVRRARAAAHTGDTVLLSPACASVDMFTNYAARGAAFARAAQCGCTAAGGGTGVAPPQAAAGGGK